MPPNAPGRPGERLGFDMKNRSLTRLLTALFLLAALMLGACSAAPSMGGKMMEEASASAKTAPSSSPSASPAASQTPAPSPAASPAAAPAAERKKVEAATADELLKAIAPHTEIVLTGRSYNLSEATGYGNFGGKHYRWEEVYDGFGLTIERVEDLCITASRSGTEILCNPRYASVIRLLDCRGVTFEGVTIGHSDGEGTCTGSVLKCDGCADVLVKNCDLYGCGTYGLDLEKSNGVHALDSTIRDCSYGAVYAVSCTDVLLDGCSIYGIESFGGVINMTGCRGCACINSLIRNNSGSGLLELYYVRDFYFAGCEVNKNEFEGMFTVTDYPLTVEGCSFKNNRLAQGWYNERFQQSLRAVDPAGKEYRDDELEKLTLMKDAKWDAPVYESPEVTLDQPDEEGFIHVSTVDELLAAIAPETGIYLEDGVYDLSTASDYGGSGGEYYYWMNTLDGPGLVIRNVKGLTIKAAGPHRARIEAQPRYCEVLSFDNCRDLTLSGFTAGHTQSVSSCAGGVLTFMNCSGTTVEDCSLFGCGVMGITANGCRSMEVNTTEIHDCTAGAFWFIISRDVQINKCNLHDIGGSLYQLYECENILADGREIPEGQSD